MTVTSWIQQVEQRAEQLLAIEQKAGDRAARPIEQKLQSITRELTKRYIQAFGSLFARDIDPLKLAGIQAWLLSELQSINADHIVDSIITAAQTASEHGVNAAYEQVNTPRDERIVEPEIDPQVRENAQNAHTDVAAKLFTAGVLLGAVTRWGDFTTVLAKVKQASNTARQAAQTTVNASSASAMEAVGISLVSQGGSYKKVWWTERNACVHCQAYAGETAELGGSFQGGLTYGKKPITENDVPSCPLHNSCRCRQELIATNDSAIPAALKREAGRSIVKGWSLESESQSARLYATEKLLEQIDRNNNRLPGTNTQFLPKTVISEAKKAIRDGKYKNRKVPVGQ